MKNCPNCGRKTKQGKFCEECGAQLMSDSILICKACGQKTKHGKFCSNCGKPLLEVQTPIKSDKMAPSKSVSAHETSKSTWPTLILALFAIIIIVIFLAALIVFLTGIPGISYLLPLPKLSMSFCNSLRTEGAQSICLSMAGKSNDDQRLRDFITNWDTIYSDFEILGQLQSQMANDITSWNNARNTQERMAAYGQFSTRAQLYANTVESTITHIDSQIFLLTKNKEYFDGLGLNAQEHINQLVSLKSTLKGTLIPIKSNLENMSSQLELEQQQAQQLNDLLTLLIRLALGG